MKKGMFIYPIIMVVFALLVATGCAKKTPTPTQTETTPPKSSVESGTVTTAEPAETPSVETTPTKTPTDLTGFDKKIYFDC